MGFVLDPLAEDPQDHGGSQREQWNKFVGHVVSRRTSETRFRSTPPSSHPAGWRDAAADGRGDP